MLEAYVEHGIGPDAMIRQGFPADLVGRIVTAIDRNEFKHRQMAPALKVTTKAFGSGRRMPIAAVISDV